MFTGNRDGKIRGHNDFFPMSDTQTWHSQLLRMLKDVPRTLPQRSDTLQMPGGKGMAQSLVNKMTLMVCRVSRRSLKTQEISKRVTDIILQSWNKEYGNSVRRTSCKRWFKCSTVETCSLCWSLYFKSVRPPSWIVRSRYRLQCYEYGTISSRLYTYPCEWFYFRCSIYSVTRLLKVVFESRPTVSRYTDMGCRRTVLRHFKTIPTTKNAPSKDLKIPNGYVNVFSFGPTWSKYTYY